MERADTSSGEYTSRAIVPGEHVRVISEAARVVVPSGAGGCEPRLDFIRDGDVIQAIDITCPCGHKMRLRCLYQ